VTGESIKTSKRIFLLHCHNVSIYRMDWVCEHHKQNVHQHTGQKSRNNVCKNVKNEIIFFLFWSSLSLLLLYDASFSIIFKSHIIFCLFYILSLFSVKHESFYIHYFGYQTSWSLKYLLSNDYYLFYSIFYIYLKDISYQWDSSEESHW